MFTSRLPPEDISSDASRNFRCLVDLDEESCNERSISLIPFRVEFLSEYSPRARDTFRFAVLPSAALSVNARIDVPLVVALSLDPSPDRTTKRKRVFDRISRRLANFLPFGRELAGPRDGVSITIYNPRDKSINLTRFGPHFCAFRGR